MQGLLADVNVQGHLSHLLTLLVELGLWEILESHGLRFVTFPQLGLPPDLDDRTLWSFCQNDQWVLFTENRNHDGPNSLEGTLADAWREGHLPVLTLANKGQFERSRAYARRVTEDATELLFGITAGQYRDQPRFYVPR